jgi:outer membrane protein
MLVSNRETGYSVQPSIINGGEPGNIQIRMIDSASVMQPFRVRMILNRLLLGLLLSASIEGMAWADTGEFPQHIDGDVGLGIYSTGSIIRGEPNQALVLPYANFDYNRISARIDTLSYKTAKLGYGYLEIAGRFSQDGYSAGAINLRGFGNKQTSIPLGLGTLQITPMGAFYLNAFHDFNKSHGELFEAIYFAELDTSRLTFYPLAGAEYQSSDYVNYYYGVSAQEAAASQYAAYQPSGAFNPLLGLLVDARITETYHLNFYLRRTWLGNSIESSPIVSRGTLDTGFVALSYRFQ